MVHRFAELTGTTGDLLSERSGNQVQKDLRTDLGLLAVPDAQRFTLKAFRAGKVSHMAAVGDSLAIALAAGEWRSSAFLHNVSETDVDKYRILDSAVAEDDEETVT